MSNDVFRRLSALRDEANSILEAVRVLGPLIEFMPVRARREALVAKIEALTKSLGQEVDHKRAFLSEVLPKEIWVQAARSDSGVIFFSAEEFPSPRARAWEKAHVWREVDAVALPVSEFNAVVRHTCDSVKSGEYDSNLEEKPESIMYAKALRTFDAQSPRETASRLPTPP